MTDGSRRVCTGLSVFSALRRSKVTIMCRREKQNNPNEQPYKQYTSFYSPIYRKIDVQSRVIWAAIFLLPLKSDWLISRIALCMLLSLFALLY